MLGLGSLLTSLWTGGSASLASRRKYMTLFHFDNFFKGANKGWTVQILEIFGRTTTLHGAGDRASYLLLQVLP
jgi:hypothetical protein